MAKDHCPYGDESVVVADYLAGRLSGEEARAFEAHSFGCDRCFDELQLGAELRAAGGQYATATEPAPRTNRPTWAALGLAAAAVLAIGLWFALPISEEYATPVEPVYRDGNGTADPVLNAALEVRGNDTVSLTWMSVEGADRYAVRVFTDAGDPLFEEETSDTAIELSPAAWRASAPSGETYVQVVALDELRQTIVQSDFMPL